MSLNVKMFERSQILEIIKFTSNKHKCPPSKKSAINEINQITEGLQTIKRTRYQKLMNDHRRPN